VSTQAHVDAILRLPDLGLARIDIEVHAAAHTTEDGGVRPELVDEEIHVRRDLVDVLTREADMFRGASFEQRGAITQFEAVDQPPKGLRVGAPGERRRLEVFVHEIRARGIHCKNAQVLSPYRRRDPPANPRTDAFRQERPSSGLSTCGPRSRFIVQSVRPPQCPSCFSHHRQQKGHRECRDRSNGAS
jgi:hypothetical protein